jgi:hypothetical protein
MGKVAIEEYHGLQDYKITTSKINTLLQCSAKHNFCFIEKIKTPSRSALLKGIAFHNAEAKNYEQKIESEKDLPIGDVLDIFGSQFDMGIPDTMWFQDEKPGEIKDSGYGMLKAYHSEIAPDVQPQSVEMPFELKLKGTDQVFAGRVDIITDDDLIIDTKTKKARPSYVDESHRLQLTAYTAGFQVTNQKKPKGARIDYVVDKKVPECLSCYIDVEDTDIDLLLNLIGQYQQVVNAGFDMPNRSSFMCSRRYCQYADECEKRFGGKVKE